MNRSPCGHGPLTTLSWISWVFTNFSDFARTAGKPSVRAGVPGMAHASTLTMLGAYRASIASMYLLAAHSSTNFFPTSWVLMGMGDGLRCRGGGCERGASYATLVAIAPGK